MQLRFGAILENPKFKLEQKYPTPLSGNQSNWEFRTATPLVDGDGKPLPENSAPLGWAKQAPGSETDVFFFHGKRGNNALVRTKNATYIALPGSKIELPDTVVELPGEKLAGKVKTVLNPPAFEPQKVTHQAMLLCGGLSTRFEPVSGKETGLPKPSVPLIEDESIARNIIEHLKSHGFTKVIVHTHYLADKVKQDLKDVKGIEIVYLDDPEASGSAGGLYKALLQDKVDISKPILVLAGDAVTNGDLSGLVNAHAKHNSAVTIGVQQVADEDVSQFGIIQTDDLSGIASGEILSFLEKPTLEKAGPNRLGSTGIYVLSPEAYGSLLTMGADILESPRDPAQKPPVFDYGLNFMPTWLSRKGDIGRILEGKHMWAEVLKGYWNDVGNPIDYLRTLCDMATGNLGEAVAKRLKEHNYENGVMFWKGTQEKVQLDQAVLDGNIIVANKAS